MNRYSIKTCIAVAAAILLSLCPDATQAQDTQARQTYIVQPGDSLYEDMRSKEQAFLQQRQNNRFPPYGKVRSATGTAFDFDSIRRPAVVLVGHARCLPCTIQLPVLVSMAGKRKYRQIDFIYITQDERDVVLQELHRKNTGKVKLFTFSRGYIIDTMKTISVFPTAYFIDRNGIAQVISSGGRTDKEAAAFTEEKWKRYIDMILK